MNGKRILVKLIWLFTGINIFLCAANLWVGSHQYNLSNQRIDNIIEVLKQEQIEVSTDLPRKYPPKSSADLKFIGTNIRYDIEKSFYGKDLASVKHSTAQALNHQGHNEVIHYCTFNQETLGFEGNMIIYQNKNLGAPDSTISLEQSKVLCAEFIKRIFPDRVNEKFEIKDVQNGTTWDLTYYAVFDNSLVLDSYMQFNVGSEGIISAKIHLGTVEVRSKEKKQIYPIDRVLFSLIDVIKQKGGQNLIDVQLVYRQTLEEENLWGQEIIPTYKITFDSLENSIFVNAYTNEMLKS